MLRFGAYNSRRALNHAYAARARYSSRAAFYKRLEADLQEVENSGLYKHERVIVSSQDARIKVANANDEMLNFCANNYLGLSNSKELIEAAKAVMDTRGFGLSSVRFICGTQDIHKQLEQAIARFHQKDDAILYCAAFDANGGLFEPLMGADDAIISDELNHASIIDGMRLCKSVKLRYKHMCMRDLRARLEESAQCRTRMIVTDGVFSMDGDIAPLHEICTLADEFDALVAVDDCHASGFVGKSGRGSAEHHEVLERVDVITSTLGKALGGASGGFTVGKQSVIDMLRQRSRPYLFSNSLPPPLVSAALRMFSLLSTSSALRDTLAANVRHFRTRMAEDGFTLGGDPLHPICPVMLNDAKLASEFADKMLNEHNIYVVAFSYPVVPKGLARIRVQISAAHKEEHLERCVNAFVTVADELGVERNK